MRILRRYLAWEISQARVNISQEGKLIFGEEFCKKKILLDSANAALSHGVVHIVYLVA